MPTKLSPRHRQIIGALEELGGFASQRVIAKQVGLNVNGASQSLSALASPSRNYVQRFNPRCQPPVWTLLDRARCARLIQHDHGTLRDGSCPACAAIENDAEEIDCPVCEGSGKPVRENDSDCYRCGGNQQMARPAPRLDLRPH